MYRRGSRRSSSNFLVKILLVAAIVFGSIYTYKNYVVFNPKHILGNSILKEKTFETNVIEIKSPKRGIKAYFFEDNTNPIISINFLFKNAGLASDSDNEVGISNLAASLLMDGAGDLDAQQFKEALENKAIGLSFSADLDDFTGSLITTADNQKEAYNLLKLALTSPRFDAEDIARSKEQMLIALKQQNEHPASVLGLEFAKEIYQEHPYARNPIGNARDIMNVSQSQLKTFIENHFTINNLVVGIAGDVSEEQAGVIIDEIFGSLPENGRMSFVRDVKVEFNGREKNINLKLPQTISIFVNRGVARNDKDFYPLYIANHIFGGSGLGSRLSLAARENEGLTYSIYSYMSLMDKSPLIKGSFSSTPENYDRVQEIIKSEWKQMGEKGVSEKELEEAKNYLISSYNLRFAAISDISNMLVYMQKDNLGLDFLKKRNDYVREVSREDVNKVAKNIFGNENLIFVNIGSFEKD